jgi:LPS-assembly protein
LKPQPFCAIFTHLIRKPRRLSVGAEDCVLTSKSTRCLARAFGALGLALWGNPVTADNACLIAPPQLPAAAEDQDGGVQIEADAATYQPETGLTVFQGRTRLTQPGRQLEAERMTYLGSEDRIEAEGQVRLTQPDLVIEGIRASYRPGSGEGEIEAAQFELPGTAGRGEAAQIRLAGDGTLALQQPAYTTCPPGARAWAVEAESMLLDRDSGRGTARGAHLELGGVELPNLPEFSFPIDDRRQSGLLPPSIGYGSDNGVDLKLPYYFNLAPNYDLTLEPRLMSRRGAMLGGEFRYLTPGSDGELSAEILPDDRIYSGDSTRGGLRWRHDGRPFSSWRSRVDASYLSDADYLGDLGNSLSTSATRHVERVAELSHLGPRSAVTLRVQDFQTLDTDPAVDRPYARLPQLLASITQPMGEHALLSIDTEYVHFDRDDSVTGQRVDLQPALALRWNNPWAYLEPRFGLRYTAYALEDNPGPDDSPDRFTTHLSIDAGLFFERPMALGGVAMTQTLEPRLYYLHVPYEDQSNLPVFDTELYDFRFDSLFRGDRFVGADRVGDANQLTLALSSRLREQRSGMERLHLGIGQIFYFDDRDVVLPGGTAGDSSQSATIAGLSARIDTRWRLEGALQWDHDAASGEDISRGLMRVAWQDSNGNRLHAGYRLRRGETEQTDIAGSWQINPHTRLIGRWSYSLERNRSLQTLAGIEYGSCCWKVRAMLEQHLDDSSDDASLGVLLQLELTGLGRLGDNIDDLMSGGLAGYRSQPLQ